NFFLKQPNSTPTPTASSTGNNDQQVEKYEKLLKENPKNMDALVALANLYLEQGELEKAIPVLEKIAVIQPNNLDWQFNLAKLYELSDQTDKAEKIYDQMLSKNPKEFKALVGKAMLRQAKGDFQTANSLFKIAEDVAPSPDLKKKIRELSQSKPK
ncbi:MAG: tetratricopeptide repeat protein, partial [Snowella sp.]